MSDAYLSYQKRELSTSGQSSLPSSPLNLRRSSLSKNLPIEKKEKSDFNNQLMMRSLNSDHNSRPLSYHGYHSKRHISSSNNKGNNKLHRRSVGGELVEKIEEGLDSNLLPRLDLDKIEVGLRRDLEIERKLRSDRDEIRRRLADNNTEIENKSGTRKNLQSRLQSSMNLQICFMNETASDESEVENFSSSSSSPEQQKNFESGQNGGQSSSGAVTSSTGNQEGFKETFIRKQSRLQAEARAALAQAKDLARLQIAQSRSSRSTSPITTMVRSSLEKVGVVLPIDRRRVSRQLLTEMNVTQLSIIVNDLHGNIEGLNEILVKMLLERDDLHMEQDSMLVDIEDLTRYLAAKKLSTKSKHSSTSSSFANLK